MTVFYLLTLKYRSYHSYIYDLGAFDWIIWKLQFVKNPVKFVLQQNWHFSLILVLYGLIYPLFNSAVFLLFIQIVTIFISSIILFKLSCEVFNENPYFFKSRKIISPVSICIFGLFNLYSSVWWNVYFDFHPDHLVILLGILSFYFIQKNRYVWLSICLFVLALIKVYFFLTVGCIGIFLFFHLKEKRRMFSLFVVILPVLLFPIIQGIIIPYYTNMAAGTNYLNTYSAFNWLGTSLGEICVNIIVHPVNVLKHILMERKLIFLFKLVMPLLFIPFLAPKYLIPTIPTLALCLLSDYQPHHSIRYHYTAGIIPFLFVAFVYGMKNSCNKAYVNSKVAFFCQKKKYYFLHCAFL